MGKVHSKHGSCFVVNAHFNPVCQLDESGTQRKKKAANFEIVSSDQHVACSELSLSSLDEKACAGRELTGLADEKYPLQVALPPDEKDNLKQEDMEEKDSKREKAEEERSEKEQRLRFKEMACDLSIENLEEFSFKLYNFNGNGKVTKDDISSLVRSIYGVVGKSAKFFPSGSKTIKVRVAISPEHDSDDEDCAKESSATQSPGKESHTQETSSLNNPSISSINSLNTATTYLSVTNCESPRAPRCHGHVLQPSPCTPSSAHPPSPAAKGSPVSPSTRCKRGRRATSLHRSEYQDWQAECGEIQGENRHPHCDPMPEEHRPRHKHKHGNVSSRDHLPECRDRRSHYLGLAGIESHSSPYHADPCSERHLSACLEPVYACPCHAAERTHVYSSSKVRRQHKDASEHHCLKKPGGATTTTTHHHHRSRSHDVEQQPNLCSSHPYALDPHPTTHENLPKVDFNLCDFVQDDKFDWERRHHRRSKSYDVYDSTAALQGNLPNSPKTKTRPSKLLNSPPPPIDPIPSSPSHHQRHRHREKNQQRSMQQVANWLRNGHRTTTGKREEVLSHLASPSATRKSHVLVERHEHHHVHEHIHHHYHHYVDS